MLPLLVVAVLGALMLWDAVQVANALRTASDRVFDARSAIASGDLDGADRLLVNARNELRESQRLTSRPLWSAFERVPWLGRSLLTARALNDTADAAARLGRELIAESGNVIDDNGRLTVTVTDGRLALEPLATAAETLAGVNRQPFERALAELRGSPASWIPAQVRDARREALELGDELLRTLEHTELTLDTLPPFAGRDGPRTYFLGMQNPAELRGTGGLIGFYSLLTVVDGEFTISDPETYDVIERRGAFESDERAPLRDNEFDGRYGAADARGFVANVNLDGDFPTVGPVLTTLAERQLDIELDGAVLIDPVGLARSLASVGPVTVPSEFADPTGQIPNPLPPELIPDVTMKQAYDVFGPNTQERDDYLRELATSAFDLLFSGEWNPIPVSRDLAAVALSRHLQLWAENPEEQAAFEQIGVAGALDRADRDWLGVTGVNAAANKLDVYTHRTVEVDVTFQDDRPDSKRVANIRVGLANQAPAAELNSYVAGSGAFDPGARFAERDGPHGLNRSWLTIWGPPTSSVLRVETDDGAVAAPIISALEKATAVDRSLSLLPRESGAFQTTIAAPSHLRRDGPDLAYQLIVRRQPTGLPDELRIAVRAPDGWTVADVVAVQAADPILAGVSAELAVDTWDDQTVVTGLVDADVHVTIRFSRGLLARLDAWVDDSF